MDGLHQKMSPNEPTQLRASTLEDTQNDLPIRWFPTRAHLWREERGGLGELPRLPEV